jgi:hypothetical protein
VSWLCWSGTRHCPLGRESNVLGVDYQIEALSKPAGSSISG